MIIEKYIVQDMAEAFEKGKASLGEDAILLTQKLVRQRGIKGFFVPKRLEVTMAVENRPPQREAQRRQLLQRQGQKQDQMSLKEVQSMTGGGQESVLPQKLALQREAGMGAGTDPGMDAGLVKELETIEHYRRYCVVNRLDQMTDSKLKELMVNHFIREILETIDYSGLTACTAVAFLGSTGVGKTTTIAKIAAQAKLNELRRVGLITMDTYRIGAVEQLKKYADIMDLPMMTVMTPAEMKPAYQKLKKSCDLVLIDTLGTSYRNQAQIEDIRRYLNEIEDLCKVVVLPATLELEIFEKTLEAYRALGIDRTILTKLDEMDSQSRLFSYVRRLEEPLAYVTTGQNVPDDLLRASAGAILSYLHEERDYV
ncbi:flagellar biosynthesis protein FlhF [Acidaminobacter hydrogenoformans]|uniref:Flagellar biosynthesis protein FlhF n=1 Tax=Acidaminobacter hydrogenoformans DSM 2784 TaxID=1120920 RepID=A0A1G5RUS5_9FIRM|nr:hypothetical protein [Acidaminobacter hydrogenoformans]SCZ77766.1 flagellar biosynthesis protein FlhF [Acidaminobacter hydrogenoformans DSM 2784]